jgi:hypothetical protein
MLTPRSLLRSVSCTQSTALESLPCWTSTAPRQREDSGQQSCMCVVTVVLCTLNSVPCARSVLALSWATAYSCIIFVVNYSCIISWLSRLLRASCLSLSLCAFCLCVCGGGGRGHGMVSRARICFPCRRYAFSPPDHVQPGMDLLSARSSAIAPEDLARRSAARRDRVASAVTAAIGMHGTLGRTRPLACIAAARMWNDAQSRVAGESRGPHSLHKALFEDFEFFFAPYQHQSHGWSPLVVAALPSFCVSVHRRFESHSRSHRVRDYSSL